MAVKKKSVTLKDVAQYAGVSPRTVSNVVNDWPYVSEEVRKKVQEAIKATGYRPNQMARSLVTGQSKTIGVVIPDIINPFFNLPIRGCEDILYKNGYNLFLCNSVEDVEREKYYLDLLISRAVDGIILWSTQIDREELETFIGNELPLVTIGFEDEPIGNNHLIVNIDDIGGAETATHYLITQGYRKIAHLNTFAKNRVAQRRFVGYRRALEAAGLEFNPRFVKKDKASIHGGYRATLKLLEEQTPDAIFCHNDLMAIGAIFAMQHLGKQVPHDLGLVGFDDIVMAAIVDPPLTTMRVSQYDIGRLTGELILKRLRNEPIDQQTMLYPVELTIRGSCGAGQFTSAQRQQWMEDLVSQLSIELPNGLPTE
jgi:LacI family transcriptional regulator